MKLSTDGQRSSRRLLKVLPFITSLFLYACAPGTQADPSAPILSEGPTPPPTLIPPIPSHTATLFSPTPYSGLPETDCFVTASKGGIQIEAAPFISAYKLLPTMEPGVPYQVVDIYPTYYQLARNGSPVGWVDYRSIGLSSKGAGCTGLFERPADTRALTDFPGLCFFTIDSPIETFNDSALTEPFITISASQPYVVLWKSRKSYFTSLSHAGPSFYVPAEGVSTFGACEGIPTSGTVTTAGWLWSKPDGQQGEKLMPLTAGLRVHIEGIPVDGNRPPDSNTEGAWVQAVVERAKWEHFWLGMVCSGIVGLSQSQGRKPRLFIECYT